MHRQSMEARHGVAETRIRALDFFGSALEAEDLREEFWPAYEYLAETIFSLRQAVRVYMQANETFDATDPAYHPRRLNTSRLHLDNAKRQLLNLSNHPLVRRSVEERGPGWVWLDHLSLSYSSDGREGELQAAWDMMMNVYDFLFECVRLASIAKPTGVMDQ